MPHMCKFLEGSPSLRFLEGFMILKGFRAFHGKGFGVRQIWVGTSASPFTRSVTTGKLTSLRLFSSWFQCLVVFCPSCSPPASLFPFPVWSYLTSFIGFSPTVSIFQSDFFSVSPTVFLRLMLSSTPFASHFRLQSFFLPLHFCLSPVLSPSLSSSRSISLSRILSHNCLKL